MMRKISLLAALFISAVNLFALQIVVNDSTYEGQTITFLIKSDLITQNDISLGKLELDESGYGSIALDLKEARKVYFYSGIYELFFFAEPESEYELFLPAFQAKTKGQELMPFFEYEKIHLSGTNSKKDDLNTLIRMFNDSYNPYYDKHLKGILFQDEFERLEQDIKQLEKPFSHSKHTFFNNYRRYKYGILRFLANRQKSKSISDEYFLDQEVLYTNPAYAELFALIYDKYFSHFARADKNMSLEKAISSSGDFAEVRKAIASDKVLQPTELVDLVILKCLHDEFYDDNYSRKAMLDIIQSFDSVSQNATQQKIARTIYTKVTKLLVGYEPTPFELFDKDSNLVKLSDFKGKHVYLNFCTCFSYTCLNEFAMLQNLYQKHKEYLEIVTIVALDAPEDMVSFLERSGYEWTFLHYGKHAEIIEDYDIRVFPTYYLIDHQGKLSMSPAASPNEEFEGRLFKELRAKGIL